MPNHVTTRCIVTGPDSEIARFRELMFKTENEDDKTQVCFDFNSVIPMPPILIEGENLESSIAEDGMHLIILSGQCGAPFRSGGLPDYRVKRIRDEMEMPDASIGDVARAFLKKHPEYHREGLLKLKAFTETGYGGWYSWSLQNWGTKWNSYSLSGLPEKSVSPFEFSFDTAWSFPTPIFKKLAEKFPLLEFECCCFDEGWGFAGDGCFNPSDDKFCFEIVDATEELYEKVYGEPYVKEEEDE